MSDILSALVPMEIRAPRGADTLEIDFEDGHCGVYPHSVLRGYCPCAVCQGHTGPIRYVASGSRELSDLGEVGDYALRLTWSDGHSTGIYSYRYLRSICACATCRGSSDGGQRTYARM
jgi:DUF971 family protein